MNTDHLHLSSEEAGGLFSDLPIKVHELVTRRVELQEYLAYAMLRGGFADLVLTERCQRDGTGGMKYVWEFARTGPQRPAFDSKRDNEWLTVELVRKLLAPYVPTGSGFDFENARAHIANWLPALLRSIDVENAWSLVQQAKNAMLKDVVEQQEHARSAIKSVSAANRILGAREDEHVTHAATRVVEERDAWEASAREAEDMLTRTWDATGMRRARQEGQKLYHVVATAMSELDCERQAAVTLREQVRRLEDEVAKLTAECQRVMKQRDDLEAKDPTSLEACLRTIAAEKSLDLTEAQCDALQRTAWPAEHLFPGEGRHNAVQRLIARYHAFDPLPPRLQLLQDKCELAGQRALEAEAEAKHYQDVAQRHLDDAEKWRAQVSKQPTAVDRALVGGIPRGEMAVICVGGAKPSDLLLSELRAKNLERLPLFKDARGRTCHQPVLGMPVGFDWALSQWSNALCGEVGELANIVKKIERGDFELDEWRVAALEDEVCDVLTYLDLFAHRAGINLAGAVVRKWNTVSAKIGCDLRLNQPAVQTTRPVLRATLDRLSKLVKLCGGTEESSGLFTAITDELRSWWVDVPIEET